MKKNRCLSNRGFTTGDIIIAIIIIISFVSIITTSFYNYYISVQSKTRRTIATNALIDVIENVEMMEYSSVNQETVSSLIEDLVNDGTIPSGYSVSATVQKYNETTGNTDKLDLIKILNVNVKYTISNKEENLEIKRLITK